MCIYKQMILPIYDYVGFMLVSCTLGQKREPRKLQNRGIRTCLLYDIGVNTFQLNDYIVNLKNIVT